LQLDGALKVFLLNSRDELNNFIQQERKNGEQNGIEWRVENNQLRFIRVYYFYWRLEKLTFHSLMMTKTNLPLPTAFLMSLTMLKN